MAPPLFLSRLVPDGPSVQADVIAFPMSRPSVPSLAVAAFAIVLTGCANQRAVRIEEHAAAFASLSEDDQAKVRQGLIDLGFRQEHVYMALGRPTRIQRPTASAGDPQTWVYHNFVYGTSAAMVSPTQTGARYGGTQITAAAVRGGVTSTPRGAPTATVDGSGSGVGTLFVDLVDGVVVRIRLDP